jgi:hypothetical protein
MTIIEKSNFLLLFRYSQADPDPTPEEMQVIFGKWVAWMKGLKAQGNLVGADRLEDGGKVLRHPRGATVTDGPFAEAKEIVGGYVIVSAGNLAQATELAQGCPGLEDGYIVEVRPIEQLPPI